MERPTVLVQLDSDAHPSVFDAIVATDAGVERLLQYAQVEPPNVASLIHGAMFTRSPQHLKNTAIFVGGSNVLRGAEIGRAIQQTFFGPVRVSVMLDGNGANATASAAVLCAARHLQLNNVRALVLGGTGPVGSRVARLLVRLGAIVVVGSRKVTRAHTTCEEILQSSPASPAGKLEPLDTSDAKSLTEQLREASVVFGCGAAGVELLSEEQMQETEAAKVAVDLNAVPPAGLGGIEATDKAVQRGSRIDYGAIGVGGLKMKIHRTAIGKLFEANDQFLDTDQIFDIGQEIEANRTD